jgi:drug/metabolite transporter (DMT)-like permease
MVGARMADPHAPSARETSWGPWLVALGAALWGTESIERIPLTEAKYGIGFDERVMVFWEHAILVVLFLPWILPRLGELRRVSWKTIGWLVFSGVAGSAVGTVLFSMALTHGNPSVVNVVLNVQPVLSTFGAWLFFRDRIAPGFLPWAAVAVLSGAVLSTADPHAVTGIDAGTGYALATALFWGLSTVAGRGVMMEMSLGLASGLRVVVGLIAMTIVLAMYGDLHADVLWPAGATAHTGEAIGLFAALATISGGIPLAIYFLGLRHTRASTAGYFEMMQTLAALVITWGIFGAALRGHQVIAGAVLVGAVAMVQRAQARA